MTLGILGKKLGMTQIFREDGTCIPVTVVQAGPCKVLQIKVVAAGEHPEGHRTSTGNRGKKSGRQERTRAADGYYAVQLGFDDRPARTSSKAALGQAKKAGLEGSKHFVREFRLGEAPTVKPGDDVSASLFEGVTNVDVVGTTKGRGWAGTIKRWNFHRQPTSHGNSLNHRTAGGLGRMHSISKGVPKGKKMAGHYGVERVTVQNLEVIKVDADRNLVYLRGAVPGHNNGYLMLSKSIKVKIKR
jgi:large subunit ribosomal protein L3